MQTLIAVCSNILKTMTVVIVGGLITYGGSSGQSMMLDSSVVVANKPVSIRLNCVANIRTGNGDFRACACAQFSHGSTRFQ